MDCDANPFDARCGDVPQSCTTPFAHICVTANELAIDYVAAARLLAAAKPPANEAVVLLGGIENAGEFAALINDPFAFSGVRPAGFIETYFDALALTAVSPSQMDWIVREEQAARVAYFDVEAGLDLPTQLLNEFRLRYEPDSNGFHVIFNEHDIALLAWPIDDTGNIDKDLTYWTFTYRERQLGNMTLLDESQQYLQSIELLGGVDRDPAKQRRVEELCANAKHRRPSLHILRT